MKARIVRPCPSGLFWGEVWDEKFKYWKTATTGCVTEWGCKRELKKYKKTKGLQKGYEFEL